MSADERHSYAEEEIGSRSTVASGIRWGDWGRERGRDIHIGASTEELEAGRRRVTLVEMTSVGEKARTAAQ
jgi:hypothetical protein